MVLVTAYNVKDDVDIPGMRQLSQAAEALPGQLAALRPGPGTFKHYATPDGSSGVLILETDQANSAFVDQIKLRLATWINFDDTKQMDSFTIANFKFGTGVGPRGRAVG